MKQRKELTHEQLTVWIRRLIAEDHILAFYKSKPWLHCRDEVLMEQHHECQVCRSKGIAEPATTVHHVKVVRRFPWLALTKSNLMAVCDACHYEIHHKNQRKQINEERW